jgi:hypothetical protein
MYKIQTAKYGHGWEDIDWENPFNTLAEAITNAKGQETHDKYHYRIVDDTGTVLWTKTIPYEGISINLMDKEFAWFTEIMADYGIPKELVFRAVLHWLSIHTTPNGV